MAEANCGRSSSDLSYDIDHEYNVLGEEFYFGDSEDDSDIDDIDRPPVQHHLASYQFEPVKREIYGKVKVLISPVPVQAQPHLIFPQHF